MLPPLINAEPAAALGSRRLLIVAEGFEPRCLEWVKKQERGQHFDCSVILQYDPRKRESRYEELLSLVSSLTALEGVRTIDFPRFEPSVFEIESSHEIQSILANIDCVVVDISVMSKLMIMMVLAHLRDFHGGVRVIYSEPTDYRPTKDEYEQHREDWSRFSENPSFGIHDVVRTPLLSSVTMQGCPSLLIGFASFNEQLLPALRNIMNPGSFIIINGCPPRESLRWREQATREIAAPIIDEFRQDNPIGDGGRLRYTASTLYYSETFEFLAQLYRKHCYDRRIVLGPTGSKMQAVACGLMRNICSDVHVEYPTPESFCVSGFSSEDVHSIHELRFLDFSHEVGMLGTLYGLDGSEPEDSIISTE